MNPDTASKNLPPGSGEIIEDAELIDLTEKLVVHSKKTDRLQRRKEKKKRAPGVHANLHDLPYDVIVMLFSYLLPGDIIRLSRTVRWMRGFILSERDLLARNIIQLRYPSMAQSFRLPVLYEDVDNLEARAILPKLYTQDESTWPYHHIKRQDPALVCSCWTCGLRWISLSIAVDFAHKKFQDLLEKSEPLPTISRGKRPKWNEDLLSRNASVVTKALHDPLWYALILDVHLQSMTAAIHRHSQNKGNKRARFRMTQQDRDLRTDEFLQRSGPPTMDFPFHRDNYYMLEVYMPCRSWIREEREWKYLSAANHDMDLQRIVRQHNAMAQEQGAPPAPPNPERPQVAAEET